MNEQEFELDRKQMEIVRDIIRDDMTAHKNWVASAVEDSDFARAQQLVSKLREREQILKAFNRVLNAV